MSDLLTRMPLVYEPLRKIYKPVREEDEIEFIKLLAKQKDKDEYYYIKLIEKDDNGYYKNIIFLRYNENNERQLEVGLENCTLSVDLDKETILIESCSCW